jgi:hypothetical protein
MVAFVREANDVFVVVVVLVVFVLLLLNKKEEEQKEEEEEQEEEEEGKAVLRVDDVEKKSSREEAFIEESSVGMCACARVCAMRGEECVVGCNVDCGFSLFHYYYKDRRIYIIFPACMHDFFQFFLIFKISTVRLTKKARYYFFYSSSIKSKYTTNHFATVTLSKKNDDNIINNNVLVLFFPASASGGLEPSRTSAFAGRYRSFTRRGRFRIDRGRHNSR